MMRIIDELHLEYLFAGRECFATCCVVAVLLSGGVTSRRSCAAWASKLVS